MIARRVPQRGVTLIEMLVASAAMLVVVGGLMSLFMTQNRAYKAQSDIVDARGSLRTGMDFIERDLKNIGMSDTGTTDIVCEATDNRLAAHGFFNQDEKLDKVVYEFVPGSALPGPGQAPGILYRRFIDGAAAPAPFPDCTPTTQGAAEVLADGVMDLKFTYYDNALKDSGGNVLVPPGEKMTTPVPAAKLSLISRIQIKMNVATVQDPNLKRVVGGKFIDIDPSSVQVRIARLLTLQSQICLRNDIYRMK